jgi:hypothetical protein
VIIPDMTNGYPIETNAFERSYLVTNITIGNNITITGENAFEYYFGLKRITLGTNVTVIGN